MTWRWVASARYLRVTHPQARVVKLIRRTRLIMAPLRNTTRLVSFATSVPLSCADCVLGIWPNFDSGVWRDVNAAPSVELVTRQVGSESGIEDRKSRIVSGFSEPRTSNLGLPVFDGFEPVDVDGRGVDGSEPGREDQGRDRGRKRELDGRRGRHGRAGPEAKCHRQQDHADGPAIADGRPQSRKLFVVVGHRVLPPRRVRAESNIIRRSEVGGRGSEVGGGRWGRRLEVGGRKRSGFSRPPTSDLGPPTSDANSPA